MEKQMKDRKLNSLLKLSGRRQPPSKKVPLVRKLKVTTLKRKYGKFSGRLHPPSEKVPLVRKSKETAFIREYGKLSGRRYLSTGKPKVTMFIRKYNGFSGILYPPSKKVPSDRKSKETTFIRECGKLSGRRNLSTGNKKPKVTTFIRKCGKETKSFDAWFRSDYGE